MMSHSSKGLCQKQIVPENQPSKLTKEPELVQNDPKTQLKHQGSKTRSCSGPGQGAKPELSGRERLKRHRAEMAGRVWIPDVWGQEDLLKDWSDCNAFDAIRNSSLVSARNALIQEGRIRANSSGLRIENSC